MASDHHPADTGGAAKRRADRLTPEVYRELAAVIDADSIEKAAPVVARLLGRDVMPANVAQQMRRARRGELISAESAEAIGELRDAIEGRANASQRPAGKGWPELLRLLETGLSYKDAAAGAGVAVGELYDAIHADRDRLAGGTAQTEMADRGRAAAQAVAAYKVSIMEATNRGDDTRARVARLEALEAAGAWDVPETAESAQASFNRYADTLKVVESPLDFETLIGHLGANSAPDPDADETAEPEAS
ncbi:MAG: hypothetical protein F4Y61_08120 [Rhodothermaceae bacterium]|nr:hypothetical protein [Rhodothermaceae bacterium]